MKNLTKITGSATPPTPQTRDLSDWIAVLSSGLTRSQDRSRWEISSEKLSRPGVRQALEARVVELNVSLTRAAPRAIASLVAGMFLRYPASANAPDQEARISAYVTDLSQFPLWAIEKAISGHFGTFAPSSSELTSSCGQIIHRVADEKTSIQRILTAEVVDHEAAAIERERVKNGFADLVERTRAVADRMAHSENRPGQPYQKYRFTKTDYERMAEQMQANPVELPQMSDELRKIVGAA